nr:Gnt-I system [Candidatus Pantoea persica]
MAAAIAASAPTPFCTIFPRRGSKPLLLDFATSGIDFGKTRVAWNKGVTVPPGYLSNDQGQPSFDPAVMHQLPYGSLLPFGLHKGYAAGDDMRNPRRRALRRPHHS